MKGSFAQERRQEESSLALSRRLHSLYLLIVQNPDLALSSSVLVVLGGKKPAPREWQSGGVQNFYEVPLYHFSCGGGSFVECSNIILCCFLYCSLVAAFAG